MRFSYEIAGYIINISLTPTDWPEKKDILIRMLDTYFHAFKVPTIKKGDAEIVFKEISGVPFLHDKKKVYSRCFERKDKHTFETYYHISIFELSQLFLIVLLELMGKNGFLLHASGVLTESGVSLFMGESGCGKSSVMKMLRKRCTPFSDDCIAIKKLGREFVCYQVPWIEKDSKLIRKNREYQKIAHVYTIKKNRPFAIKPLDKDELIFEIAKNAWVFDTSVGKMVKLGIKGSEISLFLGDERKLYEEITKKYI